MVRHRNIDPVYLMNQLQRTLLKLIVSATLRVTPAFALRSCAVPGIVSVSCGLMMTRITALIIKQIIQLTSILRTNRSFRAGL